MYFGKDESKFEVTSSNPALTGIIVSALLVILMGVLPGSIIDLIAKF